MNTTDGTETVERGAAAIAGGSWRVVAADSELGFATRMFGLIPVRGSYGRFAGELQVDEEGHSSGSLDVETATVSTGIKKRDQHLRSDDFFAADSHPVMRFELGAITATGDGRARVTGTLRIREAELPIEAPVAIESHGPDGLRIDASFPVDHRAAGLGWKRVPGVIEARAALALQRVR